MVTEDQLEALDLLVWLRTEERAARVVGTNQSTINRRSRAVREQFGVSLQRHPEGWSQRGDIALLNLERQVHQQGRLAGRRQLRLQVPFWTRCGSLRALPVGWCANPADQGLVCHDPLVLLRQRVIDACLVPSCQLPQASDDLSLHRLYSRPLELTVFDTDPTTAMGEGWQGQFEQGAVALQRVPFLPRSCQDNASYLYRELTGRPPGRARPQQQPGVSIAFLTPEMRQVHPCPWLVDSQYGVYAYVEWLVVLADNGAEVAIQDLHEHLAQRFDGFA
jgi:hypothetical protein